MVTVPNVVGLLLRAAAAKLSQSGLVAKQVKALDPAPMGTIIAQNPIEGVQMERGSTVEITMSLGPA